MRSYRQEQQTEAGLLTNVNATEEGDQAMVDKIDTRAVEGILYGVYKALHGLVGG